MEKWCGIKGTTLKFIKSYLSDRKQKVVIGDQESSKKEVKYGVPQGSVLGPILFQIYMSPIGDLIKEHGLEYHIYSGGGPSTYVYCVVCYHVIVPHM